MISIHMTTYARYQSGLLARAIESVLSQSYQDFELIICDDNSTDGTAGYLQGVAERDSRVKVFRHARNVNSVAISLGECLKLSSPERPWVSWMFDDCFLLPGALQCLIEGVNSRSVRMIFGSSDVRMRDGGVFRVGDRPVEEIKAQIGHSSILVPNGGILVHRNVFEEVGWYDPSIVLRRSCDWDLFRRIISAGVAFDTLPQTLIEEEGELQFDSLRNAFTTSFPIMSKYALARDVAHVNLNVDHCLLMPQDWIPPGNWTAEETVLMQFMFVEYFLSVSDIARALTWARRLAVHLPREPLNLMNLRRASEERRGDGALMAGGAYAALVYALFKQKLSEQQA